MPVDIRLVGGDADGYDAALMWTDTPPERYAVFKSPTGEWIHDPWEEWPEHLVYVPDPSRPDGVLVPENPS